MYWNLKHVKAVDKQFLEQAVDKQFLEQAVDKQFLGQVVLLINCLHNSIPSPHKIDIYVVPQKELICMPNLIVSVQDFLVGSKT
mgnify:CR=1 FL=1